MFVQPRLDSRRPKPPQRAEESDKNRIASSEAAADAAEQPAAVRARQLVRAHRGDAAKSVRRARARRRTSVGAAGARSRHAHARAAAGNAPDPAHAPLQRPRPPQGGSLGEALRNLQKYVDQESFSNDKGQVQNLGPLQFDTKGVEFGPWIRRFIAQVRRNWFVPYAAMSLRGHVVLTFNVHRNGALTDVQVVQPSPIDSFNTAAMNALLASNPDRAAAAGISRPTRRSSPSRSITTSRPAASDADARAAARRTDRARRSIAAVRARCALAG